MNLIAFSKLPGTSTSSKSVSLQKCELARKLRNCKAETKTVKNRRRASKFLLNSRKRKKR